MQRKAYSMKNKLKKSVKIFGAYRFSLYIYIIRKTKKTINNLKIKIMKTYNVVFHDDQDSNDKGFNLSKEDAIAYVDSNNGTNESYFEDYKGGTVQVVCNETEEVVYETEVN